MRKQEFITKLHYKLSSLPEKDVLERLGFITEMIDDRIEEGYTEEDAIRALGPIDDLAARIIHEVGASPKVRAVLPQGSQSVYPLRLGEAVLAKAQRRSLISSESA